MSVRNRLGGGAAATTSHAVSMPSGVVAGDRLIVAFVHDTATATASTSSSGWSSLGSRAQGSTTNHTLTVFTKVATGSDSLTVAVSTSQAAQWVAVCMTGDGGTPTVQFADGGSATTGAVTAVTGLTSGDYDGLVFLGLDNSVGTGHTVTPPSGYANTTTAGSSGDPVLAASMDAGFTGVTSVSPANVTWTNAEQWVTANVVVAVPAAGPSVGPQFGSAGSHLLGATASSAAVPVPSGVAAGDVILVHLYKQNTNAVTPPAGFTEIGTAQQTTGSVISHHVFWKRATGADSGTYSFTWTGSNWRAALATRYTGCVSTGNPYDSGGGAPNGAARSSSGTTTPAVSLTTQGPDRLLVWSGTNFNSGAWTMPSGFTAVESDQADELSSTAYKAQAAAGATGSITGSCASSANETAWLIALVGSDTVVDDTGTGTDTVTVVELVTVADTGTATDAFMPSTATFADTGTATDAFSAFDGELVSGGADTAVGTDAVLVVDVPTSTLLAPRRPPTTYEVLVMARIPDASAAPTLAIVDPIPWTRLEWSSTLSAPQTLDVTCSLSTLTEPVLQRFRRPFELATELWLLRNGQCVFAGPLAGGRRDGEQLQLHADGLLSYLGRWRVFSDLAFTGTDQALIVKALVDHWQGRPYGNFGIDTSALAAVGVTRDATYLASELHIILQRVQELGQRLNGFDVDVDPASRALQVWYPQRGVDRSSGEDSIVFDSRNITSPSTMFSVGVDDVATVAFGTGTSSDVGTGTLYSAKTNAELLPQYGAVAAASTWDSVKEQATLDGHVQGLLDARGEALIGPGPGVRVTPDADLGSYDVGDTVAFDVDDQLGITGAFRLRSRRVSVSESGQELVTPTFV